MPSPIAHCSLAIAAWPPLRRQMHRIAPWRRTLFFGVLLFALLAPDLDILIDPLLGRPWFENHGGPGHSLVAGLLFALPFALACRLIVPLPLLTLGLTGLLAFWSHVLLDACTRGRGVALFWPLIPDRVGLPIPLFYGVHHESWSAWGLHAITITTELAFAAAIWVASRTLRARRAAAHTPEHPVVTAEGA